jgi:serine/threonine protein kinase/tetratricopeptide (TPR) repeat protein
MSTLSPDQWQTLSPYLDRALAMAEDERGAWLSSLAERDPALATQLAALLSEHRALAQEGFLENRRFALPNSTGLAGQTLGPYTLISQIGQGGMGSVWLARRSDGRFERQAAVKFVNIALAGRATEERFKREGSILGRLTHPHIADLLDAGVSSDGQPYLVLEYVDGEAIDRYCDEHKLGVDARVRLFLDVLAAVAHAHANLIVHRDIKPSNVLVTTSGEVKLLDFGIAKLLEGEGQTGAATLLTHEGGSALTPQYAAPEQLTGQSVTTATDVYALGVLLYQLLCGRHPAGPGPHSPAELLKAVLDLEPPRVSDATTADNSNLIAEKRGTTPDKLRRELRGDLDTIVSKALKKDPQERYGSVTGFADDLQRYLKHEPISARPDALAYRAAKFLRRNRTVVTLTVTAIVLVIGSLSTGLYVANRQRKIAEQRFAQVRQLANKFVDLDARIRGLQGSTKVRLQMVSDSLQYLRSLESEGHVDKDLALDIAFAYVRVAHAQGDPTSPNLGQFAEAKESLSQASKFVDAILADDPKNRRALFIATTIAHDRMVLADADGRHEESLAYAKDAASLIERFLSLGNADARDVYSMAYFYTNVANIAVNCRRFDDGIRYCRRALEISQPVQRARIGEGSIYEALADTLRQSGDLEGALKTSNQAVELEQQQAADGHAALLINLGNALNTKGMILGRADAEPSLGRSGEALAAFQKAIDIAEELTKKDSIDFLSRYAEANYALEAGNVLRHRDSRRALAVYDQAIARIREAKANSSTQRDEAELLSASSYPVRWMGSKAKAQQRIDRAFQLLGDSHTYPADKIEPMSDAYHALQAQADHYSETGQTQKAIDMYQQLLEKLGAWGPKPDDDLRDATCISRTWTALADLLRRIGRTDEAKRLEAQRAELWNYWQSRLPNSQFLLRQSLVQIAPPAVSRSTAKR